MKNIRPRGIKDIRSVPVGLKIDVKISKGCPSSVQNIKVCPSGEHSILMTLIHRQPRTLTNKLTFDSDTVTSEKVFNNQMLFTSLNMFFV